MTERPDEPPAAANTEQDSVPEDGAEPEEATAIKNWHCPRCRTFNVGLRKCCRNCGEPRPIQGIQGYVCDGCSRVGVIEAYCDWCGRKRPEPAPEPPPVLRRVMEACIIVGQAARAALEAIEKLMDAVTAQGEAMKALGEALALLPDAILDQLLTGRVDEDGPKTGGLGQAPDAPEARGDGPGGPGADPDPA